MTWATPMIAVGLALSLQTGCAFNTSPIHTGLSRQELAERVGDHFAMLMPGDEVEARLHRLHLQYRIRSIPPRDAAHLHDRGIVACVRPPGFYWIVGYAGRSWDPLYFWFDREDRLEKVASQRTLNVWGKSMGVHTIDLRDGSP